jgi:two-component system NtrC family sensor kinase
MAKETVLVVDDSTQNVDFLTHYVLTPNGYQVLSAKTGEAGMQLAREHRPDLLLLNMTLPTMSGVEVLDALNTERLNIPVIVMTYHGSEALAVQAFRMGVKDYILKPFEATEMVESIERALTEVRLRKERDELTARLLASNQELERRVKELNTLFGIGKSVTALLDQERLLSRLVEAAIYLTNAEEGSLLLVAPATNELYMVAARGIDDRMVRSFRLKVQDSLAGEVVTSGQSIMLTSNDLHKIKTAYLVRSVIYVPLKNKGRVSGVLTVDNREKWRDFTNHDLRLLSALADYAAISLENAQLFSQVESEHTKLATILNEIDEPVVVVTGENDQVVVANTAFRRIFSLDSDSLDDQPLADVVYNPSLLKFVGQAKNSEENRKGEILLSDGRTFYATLTRCPKGRAVVMKDVTHFKELDRMESDFVSTVSHDLRAPLISIKDYAAMLPQVGPLAEKQTVFVDRITSSINHIIQLVDNLLDLSTIELGIDPHLTIVDLGRLTERIVIEFQEAARRNHQRLVHHPVGEAALVSGNPLRLEQVISNLVDNAIKYTPRNGQISTIVQVDRQQVTLRLKIPGWAFGGGCAVCV